MDQSVASGQLSLEALVQKHLHELLGKHKGGLSAEEICVLVAHRIATAATELTAQEIRRGLDNGTHRLSQKLRIALNE